MRSAAALSASPAQLRLTGAELAQIDGAFAHRAASDPPPTWSPAGLECRMKDRLFPKATPRLPEARRAPPAWSGEPDIRRGVPESDPVNGRRPSPQPRESRDRACEPPR